MKKEAGYAVVLVMLVFAVLGVDRAWAGDLPLVKPEELKKMIDEGRADMLVVDNQPQGAYEMGHIPGAVNFPWTTEIRSSGNLPRNKVLILYCACEHEEDATDVANQLIKKFGYKEIKLLAGGWIQWVKLGYPTEKNR